MDHWTESALRDAGMARQAVSHLDGFSRADQLAYSAALAKRGVYGKIRNGIKTAALLAAATLNAFRAVYKSPFDAEKFPLLNDCRL